MLVITRRTSEVIRINDDISIKVIHVDGDSVRFAVVKPNNIRVRQTDKLIKAHPY